MLVRLWRKGNPPALLVGMSIGAAVLSFLKKLKVESPYDPAITLWGTYLKEMESLSQRDIYTHMIFAALFTIAEIWKQPVFIDG